MKAALTLLLIGYWGENHDDLNEQVLEEGKPFDFRRHGQDVKKVNDFLIQQLFVDHGIEHSCKGVPFRLPDLDKPSDAATETRSLKAWNSKAGTDEDGFTRANSVTWGGLRAVNHFHQPLSPTGAYTGVFHDNDRGGKRVPVVNLTRAGISVTEWVKGGDAQEQNFWGYNGLTDCLYKFGTEPKKDDREKALACVFRSMGQVQHLIEDNSVPDHSRDLAHPGNGFEEYMRDSFDSTLFRHTPQPWPELPMREIESKGLRALWDLDVYTAANPGAARPVRAGISEFSGANYLAWNIKWVVPFTTVPPVPNVPFEGDLPWPRLAEPIDDVFPSAAGTIPLACLAKQGRVSNYIDDQCWAEYSLPLMKIAHGYALSVPRLAFWPARAELKPEGVHPLDVRKFKLRLWHLGTGESALNWTIDEIKLLGTAPPIPGAPQATAITVPVPPGTTLAPGASWQSNAFSLTLNEQANLELASHTMVTVKAHIGTGQNQTPIVVLTAIPNGFGLIKQLTTDPAPMDTSYSASHSVTDCCSPMQCSPCGETAEFALLHKQRLTGKLALLPSKTDILSRVAGSEIQAAQRHDARIAGAALVAWNKIMGRYFDPTLPTASKLNVPGLDCSAGYMCLRADPGPDDPDPPNGYDFTVDFDDSDFPMMPPMTGMATQTVYLILWTTSGAVFTQNLALWPVYMSDPLATIVNGTECNGKSARGLLTLENSGGCDSNARQMQCTGMYTSWTRRHLMGPVFGLAGSVNDALFWSAIGTMKIERLGDTNIDVSMFTATCPGMSVGSMSYDLTCYSDLNSFIMRNNAMTGSNACPALPPMPMIPRTARFSRSWVPQTREAIKLIYGWSDLPTWQLDMR